MSQMLTVQVEQVGPSTATARARTHTVLVDRPAGKGGEDRGPLGGEYLLVGLGGCFLSNLLAAIRARDAAVANVTIGVSGTIDGVLDHSPRSPCRWAVHAIPSWSASSLRWRRACAVTHTLRRSADVTIEFEGVVASE
jgi:putative redox protein